MRRDPRIINLYDRPLYPRPSFPAHRYAGPRGGGAPVLASVMIVAFVAGFFWAYDAIMLRKPLAIPVFPGAAAASYRGTGYEPVPAPDMSSEAVAFANADAPRLVVQDEPRSAAIAPQGRSAEAAVRAGAPAPRLSREAAQAFAQAPNPVGHIRTHGF
jgi:hypothetical protein